MSIILILSIILLPSAIAENAFAGAGSVSVDKVINASRLGILHVGKNVSRSVTDLGINTKMPAVIKGSRNAFGSIDKSNPFDVGPRAGYVTNITYNLTFKPTFKPSSYPSAKPVYEAPSGLKSISIYEITGYPLIKLPNSIP
jgi:hypothetical protein